MNYLNVVDYLTKATNDSDIITTDGWQHNESTPLKKIFYNKNWVILLVRPHLDEFHTDRLLIPRVEITLELFCNRPDIFLFGSKSKAKHSITLTDADLNAKLYLPSVSLNLSVCNTLQAKLQAIGRLARYPVVQKQDPIFGASQSSTCARIYSRRAVLPKPSPRTRITSSPSRILMTRRDYALLLQVFPIRCQTILRVI